MRRYIKQHLYRAREICEIKAIPHETWLNGNEFGKYRHGSPDVGKLHYDSPVQQVARPNEARKHQIATLSTEIDIYEIKRAIQN